MYLVITYDLTSNKARSKIVKILESYWFRVQKSVFEVEITKNQFEAMKKAIIYWLEYARSKYNSDIDNNDSVKFYILSKVWEWNLQWRIDWMWEWYEQAYFEDFLIL